MNILWPCHRDYQTSRSGGAERTVIEVGRRLVARGHRVTVLTPLVRGAAREEWVSGIQFLRSRSALGPHALLMSYLLRSGESSVVIEDLAHVIPWMTSLFPNQACVGFFRHLHQRTLWGQAPYLLASALRQVEGIYPILYRGKLMVVESQSSETDLGNLGIRPELIVRIPPGVDHSLFRPRSKSDRHQIVYFGGLRKYKRPDHAILAFSAIRRIDPEAELVVVGEITQAANLSVLCERLGVQKSVRFPGRLTDEDLAELVGSSWVNLHCSTAEGWCYSALEAAAAGVPTVGYDVPGLRDSVSRGRSGLLVSDGDPNRLAAAIGQVLSDHDKFSASAYSWASQFSWEEASMKWETVLLRALAS